MFFRLAPDTGHVPQIQQGLRLRIWDGCVTHVCLGVCTAGRPQQFLKCLASLTVQLLPPPITCTVVVVDNNPVANACKASATLSARSPIPIRFLHEKRQGISFARNRVLTEALALGADWVAFIDDDETAPPDWLKRMIDSALRHDADVVQGPVDAAFPTPRPYWALPDLAEPAPQDGEIMKFAATNNVLFSTALIAENGLGLRFDEAMALSGGEDTDFFWRATLKGARIVYAADPVVFEEIPRERLTFLRHIKRAYRIGANDVYIKRKIYSGRGLFLRRLPQILIRMLRGAMEVAVAPIFALVSSGLFKKMALSGGWRLFKSLGVLAGLVGFRPMPYRRIDGY